MSSGYKYEVFFFSSLVGIDITLCNLWVPYALSSHSLITPHDGDPLAVGAVISRSEIQNRRTADTAATLVLRAPKKTGNAQLWHVNNVRVVMVPTGNRLSPWHDKACVLCHVVAWYGDLPGVLGTLLLSAGCSPPRSQAWSSSDPGWLLLACGRCTAAAWLSLWHLRARAMATWTKQATRPGRGPGSNAETLWLGGRAHMRKVQHANASQHKGQKGTQKNSYYG